MKKSIVLCFLFAASLCVNAQDECIDESLIDPLGICPLIWAPVCGCDGVTYSNSCVGQTTAGITSWTDGECSTGGCIDESQIDPDVICLFIWDPVCGCDGVTYSNDCVAQYGYGVTSWTDGECGGSGCIDNSQIQDGFQCQQIWVPVCGCNDQTYINPCVATYYGGVTEYDMGACDNLSECVDPSLIQESFNCADDWEPVCGCDGVTYMNACDAMYYHGVYDHTFGPCEGDSPGCYDLGGIDFGPCDMVLGNGVVNGVCTSISGCGWTVDDVDYSPFFYESLEDCFDECGEPCPNPNIIDESWPCAGDAAPVCGCDGVSYWNACIAEHHFGITEWTDGPCSCPDPAVQDLNAACFALWAPVCGCDGVTYGNSCEAWYWGGVTEWTEGECAQGTDCMNLGDIDFGECAMPLGIIFDGQTCVSISGCDYVGGDGIDYSAYFFESMEDCSASCGDSLCVDPALIDPNVACPDIWQPVCGCDSVTYSNSCEAENWFGVTSWTDGPCSSDSTCIDPLLIDPNVLCGPQMDLVCGCDSVLYFNSCVATYYNGVTSFTPGSCPDPAQCYNEAQVDSTMACPDIWDPVCGCDGITYGSECEAYYYGGVQGWTPGECGNSVRENNWDGLQAFPNPFNSTLTIQLGNSLPFDLWLTDLYGRRVRYSTNEQRSVELNMSDVASGVYVLTLLQQGAYKHIKVIKQ